MMLVPMLAVALTLPAGAPSCSPTSQQREDLTWLRNNCHVLTPAEDRRVATAEEILSGLVTRKRLGRTFTLLVLGGLDAPKAYITPKRAILLSSDALDRCYTGLTATEGEANLAFLLAHELAHWAHADALMARLSDASLELFEFNTRGWEEQEVKADATALVDIVRAGFDPKVVLRGDLMKHWSRTDGGKAWYEQRQRAIRIQTDKVRTSLPLFDAGAALLLAGDYEVAIAMLESFEDDTAYGGREVRADIGFAKLQQAFNALAECDLAEARRFVLPGVVDTHTRASGLRGAGASSSCRDDGTFRELIEKAVTHLRGTVDADKDYAPARLNLVAALLLAGKFTDALSVTDPKDWSGLKISDQDRLAFAAARAVAEYLLGEQLNTADVRRKALADLRPLVDGSPGDVAVAYNLARMLSELGDPADAESRASAAQAWERVLALDPPRPLAAEATRMLMPPGRRDVVEAEREAGDDRPLTGAQSTSCLTVEPAALPVPLGLVDRKKNPKMPRPKPAAPLDFGLGKLYVYRSKAAGTERAPAPPTWTAYAIETEFHPAVVQLVVQDLTPPLAVDTVREQLGLPAAEVPLADGRRVLRYKGCAWVVNGEQAVQRLVFQTER